MLEDGPTGIARPDEGAAPASSHSTQEISPRSASVGRYLAASLLDHLAEGSMLRRPLLGICESEDVRRAVLASHLLKEPGLRPLEYGKSV